MAQSDFPTRTPHELGGLDSDPAVDLATAEMTERPLALITGGSSGIGFELARQAYEHGFDVILAAEHQGALDEAAQVLRSANGLAAIETIAVDLSTRSGVEALIARIRQENRPLDLLCANAGVGVGGDFARETDLEDELRMIQLNVTSQVHLIKAVLQDMIQHNAGRILITSSIAGLIPGPREAVYSGTKAFLKVFGQAITHELRDTDISVTVLMPGPTETNFFERAGLDDTKVGQDKKDDPADVAREGFEALLKGDDRKVAGWKNKVQVAMASMLSDKQKAAVHADMTKPSDR